MIIITIILILIIIINIIIIGGGEASGRAPTRGGQDPWQYMKVACLVSSKTPTQDRTTFYVLLPSHRPGSPSLTMCAEPFFEVVFSLTVAFEAVLPWVALLV